MHDETVTVLRIELAFQDASLLLQWSGATSTHPQTNAASGAAAEAVRPAKMTISQFGQGGIRLFLAAKAVALQGLAHKRAVLTDESGSNGAQQQPNRTTLAKCANVQAFGQQGAAKVD